MLLLESTNISTLGSMGYRINSNGAVVGTYQATSYAIRGFLDTDAGGFVDLEAPTAGVVEIGGINDAGQIALDFGIGLNTLPYRYTREVGYEALAHDINIEYQVFGINNLGQVVGGNQNHAWRFTEGIGVEDLGAFWEGFSDARAINDNGWIAGTIDMEIFLYHDGIAPQRLGYYGLVYGINNYGIVAGTAGLGAAPVVYSMHGSAGIARVGDYGGSAVGINDRDQVVGDIGCCGTLGFIWTANEGLLEINSLVQTTNSVITGIGGINDQGQMAGGASVEQPDGSWKDVAIRLAAC